MHVAGLLAFGISRSVQVAHPPRLGSSSEPCSWDNEPSTWWAFTYQKPRPHSSELVVLPPKPPKMPPLTSPVSHAGLFKICAFCDSSILRSNQTWGEHQASISKLEEAASEGCIFCAQLWEDLKTLNSRPAHLALPVHRWSLRRSARISESLCSLVITFRSFGEGIATPTRTFYAFNNEG